MGTTAHFEQTVTDSVGATVVSRLDVTTYVPPTSSLTKVSPTGVPKPGDTVVIKCTAACDPDLTAKVVLTKDGVQVTPAADGTYTYTAK